MSTTTSSCSKTDLGAPGHVLVNADGQVHADASQRFREWALGAELAIEHALGKDSASASQQKAKLRSLLVDAAAGFELEQQKREVMLNFSRERLGAFSDIFQVSKYNSTSGPCFEYRCTLWLRGSNGYSVRVECGHNPYRATSTFFEADAQLHPLSAAAGGAVPRVDHLTGMAELMVDLGLGEMYLPDFCCCLSFFIRDMHCCDVYRLTDDMCPLGEDPAEYGYRTALQHLNLSSSGHATKPAESTA